MERVLRILLKIRTLKSICSRYSGIVSCTRSVEIIQDFKKDLGKTLKKKEEASRESKQILKDIDKYKSIIESEKENLKTK